MVKEIKLDTSSVIAGGRTFVPVRFISEAFGATVEWDGKNKIVTITTKPQAGNEIGKMPESSYYNELYNLFTLVPKGMKGSNIEQFAYYTFKEDGTVLNLNFTEEEIFKGHSFPELSKGGLSFPPATLKPLNHTLLKSSKMCQGQTNSLSVNTYIFPI